MIVMIDNYDSFTYNVVQSIAKLTKEPLKVIRSKECDIKDIVALNPDKLIISPGPEAPNTAGISVEAILYYAGKIPILGICLGHQAIGYAFGANIIGAKYIRHGIVEDIELDGKGLFRSIGKIGTFTRYHSLVIEEESLSNDFEITARAKDGDIMGIRHKKYQIEGVQFHPESIASKNTDELFNSFLNYRRENLPTALILNTIINHNDLTKESAEIFMEDLTDGFQDSRQTAAILAALSVKGFAASEIAGCASVLSRKKEPINLPKDLELTDIVGTGGDEKGSFNISSLSSIIVSACGICIAKHGNRAVSSKSGAADFYEALGIKIDISPQKTATLIKTLHFGFLYSPLYHSAMKCVAPVRKALGIKTIMNVIGPLCNPANASYQIIGVYDKKLLKPMAQASKILGTKRVITLHSEDGFDEISPCAKTYITEIREDNIEHSYTINPIEFGISNCSSDGLMGSDAIGNANIALEILNNPNNDKYKAIVESCLLNAGVAIYINNKATSIKEGYNIVKEVLYSGKVLNQLNSIIRDSNA